MKLWVIAVGHKMPAWAETATQDYVKRMPADCAIHIKELKPDLSPSKEAVKIREVIPKGCYIIALDERGKDVSTQDLANQMNDWRQNGKDIVLLIGGADGLDQELKKEAQTIMRLSSMTLPHAMARVILVEQLYRAWTIIQGHPYHRV
jgi:23S rRNA (pseudouridine1915-N3)-methyltransferase